MTTLVDRAALAAHRARARRSGADALFLHREARASLEERLTEVNRTFTAPAIVTGHPEIWGDLLVPGPPPPDAPGATPPAHDVPGTARPAREPPRARVVPDEPVLDLEPGAHDLVIHALALHWADDPVGQIAQCRRALRPDGLFLGVTFGGQSLQELRAALAEAEAAVSGGISPRVAPMAEIRDLGAALGRAGLALPVADADRRSVSYASALHLMRDLRAMGEGNALAARHRGTPPRALFAHAARLYEAAHGQGGRVSATVEMIHLAGWAPHESQQKPLRPGSAAARLADALGAAETPLPREPG